MTATLRALLIALVIVIAASAGALFIGYRTGISVAAQPPHLDVATTGNVGTLLGDPSSDQELVTQAANRLEDVYYRPVSTKTALESEHRYLLKYLNEKKVRNADVPVSENSDEAFGSMLAYVQQHYGSSLGPTANDDLTQVALKGIMDSVNDPYTVYLSPREMQGLSEQLDGGNFGGIGVYIGQTKEHQTVILPISNMPAARAGLKPGDVVISVDGKAVKGLALDRVETMIRGTSGSTVHLVVHRQNDATPRTYRIVREIIHVPTVESKMENGYDYIRLSDFGKTSADEVRKALDDGKSHGAKGYILDLRNNGGGFLDAAVAISSYFIPSGTIVSTIDRAGNQDVQKAEGDAIPGLQPVVVLVNKWTASASEITSGALQDYHAATIVGTKTFGKGVVQSIYSLRDGGALKITTARYVTPNGRDIQHKGIEPDVVINQDPDPALIDTPADKQLAAAKARLAHPQR